ncbi:MAG: hypothetical protein KAS93_00640 [Gammaproteobacteria bacterium]|nr:hypothetical protein [Gammaproteobacteria bacterium]
MKRLFAAVAVVIGGLMLVTAGYAAPTLIAKKPDLSKGLMSGTQLTYIPGKIYMVGRGMPKGNATAGFIVALLPDGHTLIQDNMGNFYRTSPPQGWNSSMGRKIVWFTTATIRVNGEMIGTPVTFGRMHWYDYSANQTFNNAFGIRKPPALQPNSAY